MSDVTELLDQLAAGEVTLEEVAENFSSRSWVLTRPPASSLKELAAMEFGGDAGLVDGSWDEVSRAHILGKITDAQYARLVSTRPLHG